MLYHDNLRSVTNISHFKMWFTSICSFWWWLSNIYFAYRDLLIRHVAADRKSFKPIWMVFISQIVANSFTWEKMLSLRAFENGKMWSSWFGFELITALKSIWTNDFQVLVLNDYSGDTHLKSFSILFSIFRKILENFSLIAVCSVLDIWFPAWPRIACNRGFTSFSATFIEMAIVSSDLRGSLLFISRLSISISCKIICLTIPNCKRGFDIKDQ